MQRFGLSLGRVIVLSAALALIVFVSITANGVSGGILFAIAIGTAVAVAVFSDSGRQNCVPRFLRRRS
jgi:hypothetical protein